MFSIYDSDGKFIFGIHRIKDKKSNKFFYNIENRLGEIIILDSKDMIFKIEEIFNEFKNRRA